MNERLRIAVPTEGTRGMKDEVSNIFAKAPAFTFIDIKDGKVESVKVEENSASALSQGVGPVVMNNMKDRGVDIVVAGQVGPGARTLMNMSGIRMVKVKKGTIVSEAVNQALREMVTA
ncbi:MAG: NifB/NifX family molybdenum-iron cluster-binding protein [Candidatus Bathyarchaeota archaeon]|jgi:predicted Fe-Mo cluster-binding NifX family protein